MMFDLPSQSNNFQQQWFPSGGFREILSFLDNFLETFTVKTCVEDISILGDVRLMTFANFASVFAYGKVGGWFLCE